MKRETEIDIAAAEAVGGKYDEACKRLFQNREIIAPVLREVVPEYKYLKREGIAQSSDLMILRHPHHMAFVTAVRQTSAVPVS